MTDGNSTRSLSQLGKMVPGLVEWNKLIQSLSSKSDVEIAILGTSYIDVALRYAILAEFPEAADKKNASALKNYAQKASFAHATGLISSDMREDLAAIGRIRNLFAHSAAPYDFAVSEIDANCRRFRVPRDVDRELDRLISKGDLEKFDSRVPRRTLTAPDVTGRMRVVAQVPDRGSAPPEDARDCFIEMIEVAWFVLMAAGIRYYLPLQRP